MLKNWYRIFYVLFCVAGAAVYTTILILRPSGVSASFSLVCFILAPMMFFIGTIAYNALKSFTCTEKHAPWVQLGTGLVTTILFCIGAEALFKAGGIADLIGLNGGLEPDARFTWYAQIFVTFAYFGQLTIFGLMPLLKGFNKTLAITPQLETPQPPPPPPPAPEPVKGKRSSKAAPAPTPESEPAPAPARKPRTPKAQ